MFHVARHPDHLDFLFISSSTSLVRPDVSAFSTRENIMNAYRHAIAERYRMLSFGDAMFIH